jgi:hypothetical protein
MPPQLDLQEIQRSGDPMEIDDQSGRDVGKEDCEEAVESEPPVKKSKLKRTGRPPGAQTDLVPNGDSQVGHIPPEEIPFAPEMELTTLATASEVKTPSAPVVKEKKAAPKTYRKRKRSALEPSPVDSPLRSTRSRSAGGSSSENEDNDDEASDPSVRPVIFFANSTSVDRKKTFMKTLADLGGRKTSTLDDATILCIGGPLKKTANLLIAIARGIDVVTEHWMTEMHRTKTLPSVTKFRPRDTNKEREWDFKLHDAIQSGKNRTTGFLNDTQICITDQLAKDLGNTRSQDMLDIAKVLGATTAEIGVPDIFVDPGTAVIVLGTVNDPEGAKVSRLKLRMYDKELLASTILKGRLDLNNHLLKTPIKEETHSQ